MSLEQVAELIREGRGADAEKLMRARVTATADGTADRTRAWYELGGVLQALGDLPRAADSMQRAIAITARDREHEQLRLTIAWNLASVLVQLDRLDDALALATTTLAARATFYGEEHPGYGYGLEGLAEVQFARGDLADALATCDRGVRLFAATGNPRIAQTLALRAPIAKALGGSAFAGTQELPDEIVEPLIEEVIADGRAPAALRVAVLDELIATLAARPELAGWIPQLHAQLSNVAVEAGPEAGAARIASLSWLLQHMDAIGDPAQALGIELALALAEDQAGDSARATTHYEHADARAAKLGDARSRARVARNFGLFLAHHGKTAEARARLDDAIAQARRAGDADELGRCVIAQGIQLQHAGERSAAAPLLEEGMRVLPPEHPDRIVARNHLGAIHDGATCNCGTATAGIGDALLELVRETVPGDLVAGIDVELGEGAPDIHVRLTREPTDAEREALDSALHLALAAVRSGIQKRGLAPAG